MTCVRHRAVWPGRGDLDIGDTDGAVAARVDDEDGRGDDDSWSTQVIPETSLRRARIVAAINASSGADAGRGPLTDAIRARAFAAMAGYEHVRGVIVQFVTCAHRGARVRLRAWLDTGSIITVERDEDDESATPVNLAAALVDAVERETSPQTGLPSTASATRRNT